MAANAEQELLKLLTNEIINSLSFNISTDEKIPTEKTAKIITICDVSANDVLMLFKSTVI